MPTTGSDSSTVSDRVSAKADEALLDLHDERARLERDLSLAQARQRFGSTAAEMDEARAEEGRLLASLDGVLTQIRAAEYRRKPGARRW